jgi:hypothetical protein
VFGARAIRVESMREVLANVAVNVVSSVLVWLLIAVVVVIILGRRRRKLRGFFGLSDRQRIIAYLSCMPIDPENMVDRQGIRGSHRGIVLPDVEFRCVVPLMTMFISRWSDNIADLLVTMAGIYDLRKPQIHFFASPLNESEIRPVTTIAIGSIKFNTVTIYYQRILTPFFEFYYDHSDDLCVKISRGARVTDVVNRDREYDIGVLQRLWDSEHRIFVFLVGGLGANGSRAAVEFLVNNWSALADAYGQSEFGICLRCPWYDLDSTGFETAEVIIKLPR